MSRPPASTAASNVPATPQTASWVRRVAALAVDWLACTLVVAAVLGSHYDNAHGAGWWPLLLFWLEASLGTALAGGSFGQLVCRIRVLRTDARPVSLLSALLRWALVCLVIPPLVFRPDGRGLHDLATGSAAYAWPLRPDPDGPDKRRSGSSR